MEFIDKALISHSVNFLAQNVSHCRKYAHILSKEVVRTHWCCQIMEQRSDVWKEVGGKRNAFEMDLIIQQCQN